MNQQLFAAAAGKFEEAEKLNPALSAAELNQGIAYLYLQKITEAKSALQHAAEMAPADPRAWYALGLLYRTTDDTAAGIDAFQRVLVLDPSNADSHYFLGTLELQERNVDKAVSEYQEALRLDPLHASAEFGLARALQRKGAADEAREALAKFQRMTETKVASPITHNYGEEGQLGRVEDAPSEHREASPLIPITFRGGAERADASTKDSPSEGVRNSCLIDMGHDGELSLIVPQTGGRDAFAVYRLSREGNSEAAAFQKLPSQAMGLNLPGSGVACAVGDFDNDGLPDLALASSGGFALFRNLGGSRFENVTRAAGIQPDHRATGVTFVDFDHDGDLDLVISGRSSQGSTSNALWRNNGDTTFTNWTEQAGLGGSGTSSMAVPSDLNNDRAIDLLFTGSGAAPLVYFNPRSGPFRVAALYSAKGLPPTIGATVLDFDKDGWMDVALIHDGKPGVTLWRNKNGRSFERVDLPIADADRAWGIASLDIDNDGWIDLAVGVSTPHGNALRILRNRGPAGFADVSQEVGLTTAALGSPRGLLAADMDGDGATDLVVTQAAGPPLWFQNIGGNKNHTLRISLQGLADNKSAIGTKVEVFADGMWQKWEITSPQDVLAGMGSATKADLVRLLWPTGVPQDEIDVPDAKPMAVTELDRRGSSCPTLFAWNGKGFGFVADVIGAGVVGHWVAPHRHNIPDADEWIKVDGEQLHAEKGLVSLRFGEPMEEVNFIDQVRLIAVDHPASASVFPNERFLSEPPFVRAGTVISSHARPPAGAWDDHGNDVLEMLRHRDRRYVSDFTKLPYAGFANRHSLTLDLGRRASDRDLRLLLHGFIEYFSASSMYAAWQSGVKPIPPYIQAQMPDGSWKRVVDDMGFPAGLPRTIVVDLSGRLPAGAQRIRIVTNLQIYWDQILLDNAHESQHEVRVHQTDLPLASANLQFRGYPEQKDGATTGDLSYNYQRRSLTGPFIQQRGAYTRYGDVTPLLKKIDDEDVIFGTGEDIDLEFATTPLPALPKGWVRDYFFYANGFVKDMDFYDASPFTVAAMPFHSMSRYPYGKNEHYPTDAAHTAYQLEWNTRFESGTGPASYRFVYRDSAPGNGGEITP